MSKIPRYGQFIGLCIFIGLMTSLIGLYILHSPNQNLSSPQFITIPKGSSGYNILQQLHDKKLIKSLFITKIYLKLFPKTLHSGLYHLTPNMSSIEILTLLHSKKGSAIYKKISIPEGFSLKKIANRLEAENIVSANTFVTYVQKTAKTELLSSFPFLNENPLSTLEGYLFPDTYYISPSMTPKQITSMMLSAFQSKIWPLWETAPSLQNSPKARFNFHQVLTMASIIEKEARIQKEMSLISSVYYNRLKKKMRLQACPTVLYALGEPNKQKLLYSDLKVKHPYNTYKNGGIPPGPIASPGIAAMKASLNPKKTPYYFFQTKGNGHHTFTKTYNAHLRARPQ